MSDEDLVCIYFIQIYIFYMYLFSNMAADILDELNECPEFL